ncbi:uncharacterized protein LOC135825093 [Sycon ciliatum]|uniref:uncharacterized protein LOC135825093 n=1 Tax=Sycon ciliatum TaxID=27933 RepID=UPI0031F6890A
MGKRKRKQQAKSEQAEKMKKVEKDAAAAAAKDGGGSGAAGATATAAASSVPVLTNKTQWCFSKRGPRKGGTSFRLADMQDVVLRGIGFDKFRNPVCCELTNAEAIPRVAIVMLSSMTTALYARVGAQFTKCKPFLDGNSYPLQTPGRDNFVVQDLAKSFLEIKITPEERCVVEKVLPPEMIKIYCSANPMSFTLTLKDMNWYRYPLRSDWHIKETGAFYESEHLHDEFFFIPERDVTKTSAEPSNADSDSSPSPTSECRPEGSTANVAGSVEEEGLDQPRRRMFAIDCEMCKTAEEYALTSISVVDENLTCIYQTLVKPYAPIIDYVTEFSGITEEMLSDVTTRLEDVQQKLAEIIPHDAILVGHSLENDLTALKMTHRHIIDTSVLFAQGGCKQKLKKLARIILGLTIQEDEGGHDPTEDAVATMRLAQFFLNEGHKNTRYQPGVSMFALADVSKKTGAVVDLPMACAKECRGEAKGYSVLEDKEGAIKAVKALSSTDFLWLRLSNLQRVISGRPPLDWDTVTEIDELMTAVKSLDDNLYAIYSALPQHSLLMVLFDHGDIRELGMHKQAHPGDLAGYEAKVKRCRTSMFFACLKEGAADDDDEEETDEYTTGSATSATRSSVSERPASVTSDGDKERKHSS